MDEINAIYAASFVVKTLPVVLKGNNSKIKVIAAANIKKCSILFPLNTFKFLKIKITKNNAIIDTMSNPTIPVSVKISK